ncbi:hypothetical protein LZC95_50965 [Pendulispora brunnea]|uniref:Uncharacterized protein n=1 Tax=Pendulispora brunnea TaxID=2905690 RepID=A0ABZ2KCC3_9BACT
MFPAQSEGGSTPYPSLGTSDDSESTSLHALIVRAEQCERRRQEENLRAQAARAQAAREVRDAQEREWETRRQRAEAARLERAHAPAIAEPQVVHELPNKPAPAAREAEIAAYTRAMAALMGAVFALVLLESGYYVLLAPSRVARLTDASHRVLRERSRELAQMEHAIADERTKSAALAIELAQVHENNARLERELSAARRERYARPAPAPSAPVMAIVGAPPRASVTPPDEMEKRPPPPPAQEAPCHPGDPLCSNL